MSFTFLGTCTGWMITPGLVTIFGCTRFACVLSVFHSGPANLIDDAHTERLLVQLVELVDVLVAEGQLLHQQLAELVVLPLVDYHIR